MRRYSSPIAGGFTLIEVMIALAVFLILMLAIVQTFTQSFTSYKVTRAVQRDIENAQFALNLMAKELRTSTIIIPTAGTQVPVTSIRFYDYSQRLCLEYAITASQVTVRKKSAPASPDCVSPSGWSGANALVAVTASGGSIAGKFIVTPSIQSPKVVGRVTIALQISEGPDHTARIQTTASLRDYGYIEL